MEIAKLIAAAEAALGTRAPWDDIRKIVLSAGRCKQLRAFAKVVTAPNFFGGIEIEISPFCDDRIAILVGDRGVPLGLFSFGTGTVRWFDQKALKRFMEPDFITA